MSNRGRGRGNRGRGWSTARVVDGGRLKPVTSDPLDEIGLPSRGETRLHDLRKQEEYFRTIKLRYAGLSKVNSDPPTKSQAKHNSSVNESTSSQEKALESVLFALRKLREALVAARRTDEFTRDVLVFAVRTGIRARNVQTYQLALVLLLRSAALKKHLDKTSSTEFDEYHILDLACRQQRVQEAFRALWSGGACSNSLMENVLRALASSNWIRFWKAREEATELQRVIIDFAGPLLRRHAVSCLNKTYFTAEQRFVERCLGQEWSHVDYGEISWQLEDDTVVIKRMKS